MYVHLPAVLAIDLKTRIGSIKRVLKSIELLECSAIAFTRERDTGFLLQDTQGSTICYLFRTPPRARFEQTEPLIVCREFDATGERIDLREGRWLSHNLLDANESIKTAIDIRNTWTNAFRFLEGNESTGTIGFRTPQLGALYAIHAHWSVSTETATIVLPTGTGKTETMLGALLSHRCERVLVIVPTDALRSQIANKFETLGVLKLPGCEILSPSANSPKVGTLTSRPRDIQELRNFFNSCNVVVSTSALLSGCSHELQSEMANICSHLFIDEAHHAEAPTWKEFRKKFEYKLVLQFTATPFREDGNKIDGKFIYVYPLRKAQQEGYFRPIHFKPINQYDAHRGDIEIANSAMDELDRDISRKHIVMARVDSTARAEQIHEIYRTIDRYEAVVIHHKLTPSQKEIAKRRLFNGEVRVVICVDMLGEGFDMPELKIAAFHDIRKSLAVTLQLAGRFTRSRPDLGDAVFIANTALIDVSEQLRELYTQDPDWNLLLPSISESVINQEIESQEFFNGFGELLKEVPVKELRPAASMVVYKTHCVTWRPQDFRKGFRGLSSRDKLYHTINQNEKTLIVLASTEAGVRWSDVQSIKDFNWELFIAIWDPSTALLYLHGSNIDGTYRDIAKALCGDDVELLIAPNVFRCFHGVNRLILHNVGLNEFLGRQVRYTGRMGSDVESRIGQSQRQGSSRAVLAGQGYENGNRTSIGAAKRGRVWSNLRLGVDGFVQWSRAIGIKLADESLNPDQVLNGTLKPIQIGSIPAKQIVAVEWPNDIYIKPESGVAFADFNVRETTLTYVDITALERADIDPIVLKIYSEEWESQYQLHITPLNESYDFKFTFITGASLQIRMGRTTVPLEDYFADYPPAIWYADGSCLEGCEYTELPQANIRPFPTDRLTIFDWGSVDITRESQRETRTAGTIQHELIQKLLLDTNYEVIFDDDGAGEAADVVAIKTVQDESHTIIEVELYHCKYSLDSRPGARIDDLYVVCGQAQRSTCWLINHDRRTELFVHLLRREGSRVSNGRATRFERGDVATLTRIKDMSRKLEVRLSVTIVQPGVSATHASNSQLTLLAVTERYLTDTYQVPLKVICSA
jgi:superfamily II DNA or RNA helicase